MLGHKVVPSRSGGIEVVVQSLSKNLADLGHRILLLNRKENSTQTSVPRLHNGIEVRSVPTIRIKGLAAVSSSLTATIAAIRERPDVIHFHAIGPSFWIPLASLFNVRTVVTVHGLDWKRAKWGKFASLYLKTAEKLLAKFADEVIVLSDSDRNYFLEEYQRETTIVPNAIDVSLADASHLLGKVPFTSPFILFVGRIVPEKGLHTLIEAYLSLGSDVPLVIAGDHSDSKDYYEEVRALAKDVPSIHMIGHQSADQLAQLYTSCEIYVLPSTIEGMPMSLLEAISHGSCCVVSDIPENIEVLQGAGSTFQTGNSFDLAARLRQLLENQVLASEHRQKASELSKRLPSWYDVAIHTSKVYERAVQ